MWQNIKHSAKIAVMVANCNRGNGTIMQGSDAVIMRPKCQLKPWNIPWYGPKHSFLHLYNAENILFKKKKELTMFLMGWDADLFLHSNTTYNLYRIMEKKKGMLNNYLNTSL